MNILQEGAIMIKKFCRRLMNEFPVQCLGVGKYQQFVEDNLVVVLF